MFSEVGVLTRLLGYKKFDRTPKHQRGAVSSERRDYLEEPSSFWIAALLQATCRNRRVSPKFRRVHRSFPDETLASYAATAPTDDSIRKKELYENESIFASYCVDDGCLKND
jgi:hypothetical protein